MSWTTAGLPPPQGVYPYSERAGLVRAGKEMSGYSNQIQNWRNGYKEFQLEFKLEGSNLLRKVEKLIWPPYAGGTYGANWFLMPLQDAQNPLVGGEVPELLVRIISDPVITAIGYQTWRLSMVVETNYYGT
jgi:hypothetical protein